MISIIINNENLYLLILYVAFIINIFKLNFKLFCDDFLVKNKNFNRFVIESFTNRINCLSRLYNYYNKICIKINKLNVSFLILYLIL